MTTQTITDAQIVAFLDDTLATEEQAAIAMAAAESPDVARRIEELSIDRAGLQDAFVTLLDVAPELPLAEPAANERSAPRGWWQAVAAALIFAAGLGAGSVLFKGKEPIDWHVAVADYQVLYATETLTGMKITEQQRWESLTRTSRAVGLDLSPQDMQIEGLEFRRAQVLDFQGQPLAQLAFLDGAGNPVALCVTRTDGPDADAATGELSKLATMTWQRGGLGFILIGGTDAGALRAWQEQILPALDT